MSVEQTLAKTLKGLHIASTVAVRHDKAIDSVVRYCRVGGLDSPPLTGLRLWRLLLARYFRLVALLYRQAFFCATGKLLAGPHMPLSLRQSARPSGPVTVPQHSISLIFVGA